MVINSQFSIFFLIFYLFFLQKNNELSPHRWISSQSQNALMEGFKASKSPVGAAKPLLFSASSIRPREIGTHEPNTTRHSTLGNRHLWDTFGSGKARV